MGPRVRTSLLKTLGSARGVRAATVAELAAVPTVTPKLAQRIYDHFHPPAAVAEPPRRWRVSRTRMLSRREVTRMLKMLLIAVAVVAVATGQALAFSARS